MNFSEDFLNEIAGRNEIEDVVGSYVRLEKRSGQNLFGLCPFHSEKTASFSVSPAKQIYYCFGCGKGGGVINFIMEIEGMNFPEAVEFLANRAGIKMPEEEADPLSQKRSRMLALNKAAARFFYDSLHTPAGQKARAYLEARKLSAATAKNFGLGFAPDTWDSLKNAMNAAGWSDLDLFDAGLVKRGKNGGFYDAFRNRLMFPVIDVRGNVIGFSGRILGEGEPKYLNTPETRVFDKGSNLFGLNLAKKSRLGYLILVEGNVDVVMLHQAGFDCAVASLGTSLTAEQARLISRYTNEVVLAYDSDAAGQKASQRAIGLFEKLDVKTKVLRMDGAKDPDEYIKAKGSDAFRNLIERSESQIDFRLQNILKKYSLDIPEQKVDYLKEASALIATFPGSVERQVYALRVAELASVPGDAIQKEVEQQRRQLLNKAKKADARTAVRAEYAQPADKSLRYDNIESAKAEEGVIRLMTMDPGLKCELSPEEFSSPALRHIYSVLREHDSPGFAVLSSLLSSEEMNLLIGLGTAPESKTDMQHTMNDYVSRIRSLKRSEGLDLRELASKYKEEGKGYK